ncbi:MAG: quinolinate synthase NadA [Methanomicrobiales archaeon]|nr:quinolinate synthase NadA [Methanomicrobiales archaeon]
MADRVELTERIQRLKAARSAVILAHNYQPSEVQDIADDVGDSLELSRIAAETGCRVIVFCGVDFMAETAAILSPEKVVLLPAVDARCSMAGMITAEDVRELRRRYPQAAVVSYVNTSAEVKAESDICCTSANAVKVVDSLQNDEVIFLPDRNLGRYVARFSRKRIILGSGYCSVHEHYTRQHVMQAKRNHPEALLVVHPECRPEVIDLADHVASTSGIVQYVCSRREQEFVIGTEIGLLHRIQRICPGKICHPLSMEAICGDMKRTDLEKVRLSLERMEPRVSVPEEIAIRARRAIERMLEVR